MKKINKVSVVVLSVVVLAVAFTFGLIGSIRAATQVTLLTADNFAVLAGSAITASNVSVVVGDVGLSPNGGSSYNGLTTPQVAGTIYAVDPAGPAGTAGNNPGLVNGAKNDLVTAYGLAAGQPPAGVNGGIVAADLGGQTLTPGVYRDNGAPASLSITGTLTLDGQGNPSSVFIFQSSSTLITAATSTVSLINGAQACNVFWQVGSSATFGTFSNFSGNVLALASITDNGSSTITGRLLARTGQVTLNYTHLTRAASSGCVLPGPRPGTINVVKIVINGNGGTKTITDFPLFVNGTQVVSGATNSFPAPGPVYTVTEISNSNYTRKFSGDCDANGQMNLSPGNNKFCIVTNSYIGAPVVVPPVVVPPVVVPPVVVPPVVVPPLINLLKTANPLSLPAGHGTVVYTYKLRNVGTVPVTDITIVDDTCSPTVRVSGDTDGNNKLDLNETWVYTCTQTLSATHTNIAVATGWANGIRATAIANATVVVATPKLPNTGLPPREESIPWQILAGILIAGFASAVVLRKRAI